MKNDKLKKEVELTNELKNAVNENPDSSTFSRIYNEYHDFILKNGLPSEKRKKTGYLYAPPDYQNLAEKIIFGLIPNNSKVLEIGFGDGRLSYNLAKNKNCLVSAIDISDLAVEMAKKNFQPCPNLNYIKGDARKILFNNESFDIVTSKDLIEHLPEKDHKNHFYEVKRTLKQNGYYVFFTPPKIIPRKSRGLHLKEYSLSELLKELKDCGFKNEKIYLTQAIPLRITAPLSKFLIKIINSYEALMEKTKINNLLIFGGIHKILLPRCVISVQKGTPTKMQSETSVSIVIPSYNRRQALEQGINSISGQNIISKKTEIIVVDDGSNDDTDQMIKKFPEIKYLKQSHKGAAAARNKGAFCSSGEFIFFFDSDCSADENCLKELLEEVKKNKNTAMVGCRIIGKTPGFFARCHDYAHYSSFMTPIREKRKFLCASGILIKKEALINVGGFNENLRVAEDEDLGLRINERGYDIIYQPKAIVYHFHGRNKFKEAVFRAQKWAAAGSVNPYLTHKESKYGKIASTNPYFYLFFSPLIAFLVSARIFVRIFPWDKKIILYFPFILLNKFLWCLGTYRYLKNEDK